MRPKTAISETKTEKTQLKTQKAEQHAEGTAWRQTKGKDKYEGRKRPQKHHTPMTRHAHEMNEHRHTTPEHSVLQNRYPINLDPAKP